MKKNDGFTLIEVLVSIVILGMLLTSFFQFFVFSQKTTMTNKEKLVAVNIAQAVLEQVKNEEYPEITNTITSYDSNICAGNSNCIKRYQIIENGDTYKVNVNIGEKLIDLAESNDDLYQVTVTITGESSKASVKGVMEL